MSVAFNPNQGLVVVPVRLFGHSGDVLVRMALDTGASRTLVSWDVAMLVGLRSVCWAGANKDDNGQWSGIRPGGSDRKN